MIFFDTLKSYLAPLITVTRTILDLNRAFSLVLQRVNTPAPLPRPSPTDSAWQDPPHSFPTQPLPERVDVLVIGSGITGASFAKTLLESPAGRTMRVAMVDARAICSGATGRNGGHIKTTGYDEYAVLSKHFGAEDVKTTIEFRHRHLGDLLDVAKALGEEVTQQSEIREVETLDIFHDQEVFHKMLNRLADFKSKLPDVGGRYQSYEGEAAREKSMCPLAVGVIAYPAGALSPYRLVTAVLSHLVTNHPNFSIHAGTPIASLRPEGPGVTLVSTSTGARIIAEHIVHATNGYASHLLPGLTGRVFPIRGTMSSQPPGTSFPNLSAEKSWCFVWKKGYDYLVQRPDGAMMLGGGLLNADDEGLAEVGVPDDDSMSIFAASHIRGLLPTVFRETWGKPQNGDVRVWTGIVGWSMDMLPWVGEVGKNVTGRRGGAREWVSVGYSGEGMVNAWGCGAGLAQMMLGEEDRIPNPMRISSQRLKKARVEDYVDDYF